MDGLSGRPQRKRDLCHNCRHTGSLQLYTRSKGSFGNIPRRWAADRCCIHRKMLKSSIWCQETFFIRWGEGPYGRAIIRRGNNGSIHLEAKQRAGSFLISAPFFCRTSVSDVQFKQPNVPLVESGTELGSML